MDKKDKDDDVKKVKTQADKIWDEIKGVTLDMFSLPNQTVQKFCTPVVVEPTKLYLTYTIGSILPALEEAIGSKFNIEQAQKYLVVSKK